MKAPFAVCCSKDSMEKQGPVSAITTSHSQVSRPLISGEDCLRYLCETGEEDAVHLLKALHQRKPQLIPRVMPSGPGAQTLVSPSAPSAQSAPVGPGSTMAELRRPATRANVDGGTSTTLIPKSYVQYVAGEKGGSPAADAGENTDSQLIGQVALQKALEETQALQATAFASQSLKLDETLPIVALSSQQYFTSENAGKCVIDVMRLGNSKGRSVVGYRSRDWSAHAGKQYLAVSGSLVFEPGETVKDFGIRIVSDDEWHTTTEFIIELVPDGCTNCLLDQYLNAAKVKVIDDDCFPSNKYSKEIRAKDYHKIKGHGAGLVIEYFRLNFRDPVVRGGTIKMMLVDQLHNYYFVLKLFMNVYLVDIVLKKEVAGRYLPLLWLCVVNVFIFGVLYVLDIRKHHWKVGGKSRSILQKSILRKFFNYDEASRKQVNQGMLVMAMTRDAVNVVTDGYMSAIKLVRAIGQIGMILLFQLTCPPLFQRQYRVAQLLLPVISFPVLLISFLAYRMRLTRHNFMEMLKEQDDLVEYVNGTYEIFRLIADYNMRGKYVDQFEIAINELNRRIVITAVTLGNNLYFPQWITTLFVSIYMVVGGMNVADPYDPNSKGATLGMFLSDIAVFTQIGLCWGVIYQSLLEILTVFPPLERLTTLANLATDVTARGKLSDWNREGTRERQAMLIGKGDRRNLPLDLLPIRVKDIELNGAEGKCFSGLVEVRQGNLVALVGRRGQGKATLLRLISGVILPKISGAKADPGVFMPSHVRVLHVSLQPLFYVGTLYENLTYGVKSGSLDGSRERVVAICRLLKISEDVIRKLQTDEVLPWDDVLSHTQMQAICLARALVTNPEILCLHKPTQAFDPESALNVMKVLRMLVTNKGVETDDQTWHLRRIRTCVFTSTDRMNMVMADQVIHISADGIREIDKARVSELDLC